MNDAASMRKRVHEKTDVRGPPAKTRRLDPADAPKGTCDRDPLPALEDAFSPWADAPESSTVWSFIIDVIVARCTGHAGRIPKALSVARTLVSLGTTCQVVRERVRAARVRFDVLLSEIVQPDHVRVLFACSIVVPSMLRLRHDPSVLTFTLIRPIKAHEICDYRERVCLVRSGLLCHANAAPDAPQMPPDDDSVDAHSWSTGRHTDCPLTSGGSDVAYRERRLGAMGFRDLWAKIVWDHNSCAEEETDDDGDDGGGGSGDDKGRDPDHDSDEDSDFDDGIDGFGDDDAREDEHGNVYIKAADHSRWMLGVFNHYANGLQILTVDVDP